MPDALNAFARATKSGELQFEPAPCVSTKPSPSEFDAKCKKPRTVTFFGEVSRNSRT